MSQVHHIYGFMDIITRTRCNCQEWVDLKKYKIKKKNLYKWVVDWYNNWAKVYGMIVLINISNSITKKSYFNIEK